MIQHSKLRQLNKSSPHEAKIQRDLLFNLNVEHLGVFINRRAELIIKILQYAFSQLEAFQKENGSDDNLLEKDKVRCKEVYGWV